MVGRYSAEAAYYIRRGNGWRAARVPLPALCRGDALVRRSGPCSRSRGVPRHAERVIICASVGSVGLRPRHVSVSKPDPAATFTVSSSPCAGRGMSWRASDTAVLSSPMSAAAWHGRRLIPHEPGTASAFTSLGQYVADRAFPMVAERPKRCCGPRPRRTSPGGKAFASKPAGSPAR